REAGGTGRTCERAFADWRSNCSKTRVAPQRELRWDFRPEGSARSSEIPAAASAGWFACAPSLGEIAASVIAAIIKRLRAQAPPEAKAQGLGPLIGRLFPELEASRPASSRNSAAMPVGSATVDERYLHAICDERHSVKTAPGVHVVWILPWPLRPL